MGVYTPTASFFRASKSPRKRMYSERRSNQVEPARRSSQSPQRDLDGGMGMPFGLASQTLARSCRITCFFASLFCATALFSPAFAGANGVPASAPDDAADLRSAKESFDAGDYVSARKTLQAALEISADD